MENGAKRRRTGAEFLVEIFGWEQLGLGVHMGEKPLEVKSDEKFKKPAIERRMEGLIEG